jgi:plasmid stabilization system protein ParE
MNFQVIWVREAERQLTRLWVDYPGDRNAITAASHEIDRLLADDPGNAGESRDGEDRILIVAPLVVYFRVDAANRIVRVGTVRRLSRRQAP